MEVNFGIPESNRQTISSALASLLADTYAIYLKTQNFHWNLTGIEFFSLHLLFEKQYKEIAEAIDEIAERIRTLGFFVEASFSGLKKITSIPDEDRVLPAREMLIELIKGHEILIRHARKLSQLAENEKDPATVDLLARRLGAHEKFTWMLRSHI